MRTFTTKKSLLISFLTVASLTVASVAHADSDDGTGFVELAVGQMTPLGEDQWEDVNDEAFKFGVHGGMWARRGGLGVELALDYTPLSETDDSALGFNVKTDLNRMRLLAGGRMGVPVAKNLRVFGRLLLGVDYIRGSYEIDGPGGLDSDGDESDVGLGAEIGGGIAFSLGAVSIGAQVAVPMAFHFTEQDVENEDYLDMEYNAYDLDLMLTVGTAF